MKKLIYFFLVLGLFACSSDSDDEDNNIEPPLCDTQVVYLDSNGVTIKSEKGKL